MKPLAFRIRPTNIDDIIGQKDLVGENGILRKSIENSIPFSFILYGSPGTGKTTIAEAYCNSLNCFFIKLNATTSNKKDIENAIEESKKHETSIIIIDEIHRINKDKQDLLLPYLEDGTFYLIGATTANPYISINKAIRSRTHILEVKNLTKEEISDGLKKAISKDEILKNKINITEDSLNYISSSANGDFRFALNYLEILFFTYNGLKIDLDCTKKILKVPNYSGDKNEDVHYDNVSALQKSIRGSDVNAALYYAARIIKSGDLQSLYRRLLVCAYEDIGIANPQACMRTKIAIESADYVGLPEAIIPLSVAIVDLCLSPKSKEAELALNNALSNLEENLYPVPDYLRYTPVNLSNDEKYPYNMSEAWIHIQYLPEEIKNVEFYKPNLNSTSSYEKSLNENYKKQINIKKYNSIKKTKRRFKKI